MYYKHYTITGKLVFYGSYPLAFWSGGSCSFYTMNEECTLPRTEKHGFFNTKTLVFSQDCRVTRQGFCAAMVHTALAGTVSIVADRPCLPTHYKLYVTLQVTLLVHWLRCAHTTHPKEPASSVFACFTSPSASLLVQAKFYPDPLPYPQRTSFDCC
jgi:hypothetical protein